MVLPKPAPDWWIEKQQLDAKSIGRPIPSSAELHITWTVLGRSKRANIIQWHKQHVEKMKSAASAVAAGTASHRQINWVSNRGVRQYQTPEESERAYRTAQAQGNVRQLAERLEHRSKSVSGCSIVGCPLERCSLLALLPSDHRDGEEKKGNVTQMSGETRDREYEKTDAKCWLHHWEHTKVQRGHLAIDKKRKQDRRIAELKRDTGCQHPGHDDMPYASLVLQFAPDPLFYSFLEVNHWKRTAERHSKYRSGDQLKHLQDGTAVVHCGFCHRLWTRCELYSTALTKPVNLRSPYAQHQQDALMNLPGNVGKRFFEFFERTTTGVNWAAVAEVSRKKRKTETGSIEVSGDITEDAE
jgi:hypothetical protein